MQSDSMLQGLCLSTVGAMYKHNAKEASDIVNAIFEESLKDIIEEGEEVESKAIIEQTLMTVVLKMCILIEWVVPMLDTTYELTFKGEKAAVAYNKLLEEASTKDTAEVEKDVQKLFTTILLTTKEEMT